MARAVQGAWSLVFEAIASCTRRSSRGGGAQIAEKKGWDLFGLNSDRIKKMLMEMEGVEQCTKLRYNKERAAREAKEQHKLEEEEEREDRERDKKRKEKMPKAKKGRSSEYQQPPMLEQLKPGQWRCMEDDMEVVPGSSEEQVKCIGLLGFINTLSVFAFPFPPVSFLAVQPDQ